MNQSAMADRRFACCPFPDVNRERTHPIMVDNRATQVIMMASGIGEVRMSCPHWTMACGANPSRAPNKTQHQPMIERLFQPFRDPNLPPSIQPSPTANTQTVAIPTWLWGV